MRGHRCVKMHDGGIFSPLCSRLHGEYPPDAQRKKSFKPLEIHSTELKTPRAGHSHALLGISRHAQIVTQWVIFELLPHSANFAHGALCLKPVLLGS